MSNGVNVKNFMNKNLIIIFVIGVVIGGGALYLFQSQQGLSLEEAGKIAMDFINQAIQEDVTASLVSISEEGNVYKIHLKIGETEYDSYITKDGKFLFPSGFNLEGQTQAETPAEETPSHTNLDGFAKCLTDKGMKFYGSKNCGWCAKEKELFGDSLQYVTYIECVDPETGEWSNACKEAKIEAVPTWQLLNGEKVSGFKTLEQLSELSGCQL